MRWLKTGFDLLMLLAVLGVALGAPSLAMALVFFLFVVYSQR
jgi:hypothetical protein